MVDKCTSLHTTHVTMTLSISRAGLDDGPGYAQAYVEAFFEDYIHAVVFNGMLFDEQVKRTIERWPGVCKSPSSFTQKIVDTETNEIIAFARWTISNSPGLIKKLKGNDVDLLAEVEFPTRLLDGMNKELLERFVANIDENKTKYMGSRPYMRGSLQVHHVASNTQHF